MRKAVAVFLVITALFVALPCLSTPAAAQAPNIYYPHYLRRYAQRYEDYSARNPELPFSRVIAYVNAGVDIPGYSYIQTIDNPDDIKLMINKNFRLPPGYEPGDMADIGYGSRMRAEAARRFLQMKEDAAILGYRLVVISTFRSFQNQAGKYNEALASFTRERAEQQFARPGHSEHQTGLAIDILHRMKSREESMSDARFENTGEYAWLRENAHNYGFIQRYPREYRDVHGFIFEPWHWRYVGVEVATAMFDAGIGLFEEYYGMYLAPGVFIESENVLATRRW